ncbi:MAG: protein-glutamate O-methyltransferase CheR [Thermodesulfovibrionales bacterium]
MIVQDKKTVMSEDEFNLLRDLIHNEFGILLKGDRRLTLHTKISHRLSILGLQTYRQYYDYIMSDATKEELYIFISHITNNETYFFRENAQLEVFSALMQNIKKEKQQRNESKLRIVSLASSSGEEAYTLNILVQESGLFVWDWDTKIIGIDVDRNAIEKAKEACYTSNSFRSINGNSAYVDKYFNVEEGRYVLRRSLTKNVEFKLGNILERNTFEGIGLIDVIFCRNVLIYMSDEAIIKLAGNFYDCLSDTGYLFIGSSESLIQKTNLFVPEYRNGIIVYRKNISA